MSDLQRGLWIVGGSVCLALGNYHNMDRRRKRIAAYNQQRENAIRTRWELMIHREALGFRRHELEKFFPIPPPRMP